MQRYHHGTFCQLLPETTLHLFWKCRNVQKMWKALTKWVKYILKIDLELTAPKAILLRYNGMEKYIIDTSLLAMSQHTVYISVNVQIMN